jgi:Protein of unknown function (DUF2490)
MKFTRLSICVIVIVLIFPKFVYSQSDDFGIWYGINAGFPLAKKLDINVSTVIRTFNNASKINQGYLEGGVSYKFNKYLSVAGSYRFIDNRENNSEFHIRHKWFADVKGSFPLENFLFSARFRFQIQTKTFIENEKDRIPDYHGRIKLKALYKIPEFPVNPYLSVESFSPMFVSSERLIDKNRFTIGFEYKITKIHSIEAEYIFQRDFLPHLSDIHIISINYNLKF